MGVMNEPTQKMFRVLLCAIPVSNFIVSEAAIEFCYHELWFRIARSAYTDTGFVCTANVIFPHKDEICELICELLSIWEKILLNIHRRN